MGRATGLVTYGRLRTWLRLLLLFWLSMTASMVSRACWSPLVLDDGRDKYLLGPHARVLVDPGGRLGIDEVVSASNAQAFRHDGRDRPNFGFTHAAHWFCFTIDNRSATHLWYLDATREWVEHVELYSQDSLGWKVIHAGTDQPFSYRQVANERPILPLAIEPGSTQTYYLRLKNSASLALVGDIVKPSAFAIQDDLFRLQYGAYYGALLIMAAYNFFLFVSIRDRSYGYLSLLIGSVFLLEASAHGHVYRYLGTVMNTGPGAFALGAMGVAFALLTRTFLRSSKHLPRIDKALYGGGLLSSVVLLLAPFSGYAMTLGFVVVSPLAALCVIAAFLRWRQGFAPAAYFFFATLAYILPGQVVVAQYFGLVPPSVLSEYGTHVGVIAMTSLFSFGLADQIRRLHRASEKFVPKALIRQLGRETLAEVHLGDATDLEVTVLFSDIRSFTAISEKLSPSENFEFINAYLALASPAIHSSGGIIDKYIGDAIMAVFPGDASNALTGTERLMEATGQFNSKYGERYPEVRIGVGLHRGHVRLGTLGDDQRMNATVISDTVNTASRL